MLSFTKPTVFQHQLARSHLRMSTAFLADTGRNADIHHNHVQGVLQSKNLCIY